MVKASALNASPSLASPFKVSSSNGSVQSSISRYRAFSSDSSTLNPLCSGIRLRMSSTAIAVNPAICNSCRYSFGSPSVGIAHALQIGSIQWQITN